MLEKRTYLNDFLGNETALSVAIKEKRKAVVSLLLDKNAKLMRNRPWNMSVFEVVAGFGSREDMAVIAEQDKYQKSSKWTKRGVMKQAIKCGKQGTLTVLLVELAVSENLNSLVKLCKSVDIVLKTYRSVGITLSRDSLEMLFYLPLGGKLDEHYLSQIAYETVDAYEDARYLRQAMCSVM